MRCIVVLFFCLVAAGGQPMSFGQGRDEKAPAVKSDIPYIRCQVCENLIREAFRSVKQMREDAQPGKKVKEEHIIEHLEQICDPDTDEGAWISKTDLLEKGDELKLVDMGQVGDCNTECRTIARACEDILENWDMELAEQLFKDTKQRAQLTSQFCREEADFCSKKPSKLPKNRPKGPAFKALTPDEIEMKKMMRNMKQQGMGGQVFDRQSMMDQMGMYSEDDFDQGGSGPAEMSWINIGKALLGNAADSFGSYYTSAKSMALDLWAKAKKFAGGKSEL